MEAPKSRISGISKPTVEGVEAKPKILAEEDIAQVYVKEVFSRHRVLDKIILDRDTRFILAFWQVFIAEQGIKTVVSTAYYPQIDG